MYKSRQWLARLMGLYLIATIVLSSPRIHHEIPQRHGIHGEHTRTKSSSSTSSTSRTRKHGGPHHSTAVTSTRANTLTKHTRITRTRNPTAIPATTATAASPPPEGGGAGGATTQTPVPTSFSHSFSIPPEGSTHPPSITPHNPTDTPSPHPHSQPTGNPGENQGGGGQGQGQDADQDIGTGFSKADIVGTVIGLVGIGSFAGICLFGRRRRGKAATLERTNDVMIEKPRVDEVDPPWSSPSEQSVLSETKSSEKIRSEPSDVKYPYRTSFPT